MVKGGAPTAGRAALARAGLVLAVVIVASSFGSAGAQESTTTTAGGAPVDGRYRGYDDGGGFTNILPPGQNAGVTEEMLAQITDALAGNAEFPPHYEDQLRMYDALVQADELDDTRLRDYFKDASFGVPGDDIGRVYHPHDDATVIRDLSFGVPHIYGRTRYATMFAQGYTTAEDRLFFMDVLRHLGRGRLSELVGYSDQFAGRDKGTVASSPYTEADLTEQIRTLEESGPDGAAIVSDVEAYADGVNAFIEAIVDDPSLQPIEHKLLGVGRPEPWVPEDAVAIATLVGGIFGRGGGREVENACGLQRLTANLGGDALTARTIFDDLHFVDDPASPTTGTLVTPYSLARPTLVDPDANPAIDCTSLKPINEAAPATDDLAAGLGVSRALLGRDRRWSATVKFLDTFERARREGPRLSNAILVAGNRTTAGRPIAVFGPQIGYSAPELLTEKDVHGPGIDARGVGFLGVDFYVLLGRGNRYAWSATSSGSDNVDQVVLRLCEPAGGRPSIDSTGYDRDGICEAFETWDHVIDAPATQLAPDATRVVWTVQRSAYGPVLWRGTLVDGTPIAIVEQRSTYRAEVDSAIGFKQLNDPEFMAPGAEAFRVAVGRSIGYTFNWFYVDDRDIAFQDSCRCPIRAGGTDPTLPVLAGAGHDWTGEYLDLDQLPHETNPESGYIVSWNNRPAPGWQSSDAEFEYGPVHRSQLLSKKVEALLAGDDATAPTITRADIVTIMRDAGTQDLRGVEMVPRLLAVMGDPPADIDPRVLDLRERLEIWSDNGAFRRDDDGDGEYEDAVAPAIVDAWWPHILDEVFADDGDARRALRLSNGSRDGSSGSASALAATLDGTTQHPFCEKSCRDELWRSLRLALPDLRAEFKTATIADWKRTVADDDIEYATLLAGMPSIDWQNRPTFQQVVQLETESDRPEPPDGTSPTSDAISPPPRGDGNGGTTGVKVAVGAVALAAIVALAIARQRRRRA